jgi:hypothetical protein
MQTNQTAESEVSGGSILRHQLTSDQYVADHCSLLYDVLSGGEGVLWRKGVRIEKRN